MSQIIIQQEVFIPAFILCSKHKLMGDYSLAVSSKHLIRRSTKPASLYTFLLWLGVNLGVMVLQSIAQQQASISNCPFRFSVWSLEASLRPLRQIVSLQLLADLSLCFFCLFPTFVLAFKGTRNNSKNFIWTNLQHLDNVLFRKRKEEAANKRPRIQPCTLGNSCANHCTMLS